MSYTRTMTGNVYWQTSGSVSYPPSESGGSVSYHDSGSIPVTINVHVDTTSFDGSVAVCGASLASLGGAVNSASSEQCQSIDSASEVISNHITNGFYTLIKSDLSQNMAHLIATVTSCLNLLSQKAKLLKNQHTTMEKDYNRIFARYEQIFSSLDEECKKRIIELDKNAYRLSQNAFKEQLTDLPTQQSSKLLALFGDTSATNQKLLSAHTKEHTKRVIERLGENVTQDERYKAAVSSVTSTRGAGDLYTNVIFYTYDDIEENREKSECTITEGFELKNSAFAKNLGEYAGEHDDFGRDFLPDEALEDKLFYYCDNKLPGAENERKRELIKKLYFETKKKIAGDAKKTK